MIGNDDRVRGNAKHVDVIATVAGRDDPLPGNIEPGCNVQNRCSFARLRGQDIEQVAMACDNAGANASRIKRTVQHLNARRILEEPAAFEGVLIVVRLQPEPCDRLSGTANDSGLPFVAHIAQITLILKRHTRYGPVDAGADVGDPDRRIGQIPLPHDPARFYK